VSVRFEETVCPRFFLLYSVSPAYVLTGLWLVPSRGVGRSSPFFSLFPSCQSTPLHRPLPHLGNSGRSVPEVRCEEVDGFTYRHPDVWYGFFFLPALSAARRKVFS